MQPANLKVNDSFGCLCERIWPRHNFAHYKQHLCITAGQAKLRTPVLLSSAFNIGAASCGLVEALVATMASILVTWRLIESLLIWTM